MAYRIPTGTKDILPAEAAQWQAVETAVRDVMRRFNYKEIRTPIFEYTELFTHGIGEATDVVGKEMYTFLDKGEERLTLRPEMTASVMRAYIEHSLGGQSPITKLYYLGPMFRQERPQKGRLRQFTQFGVEALGSPAAEQDVETILVALAVYASVGLRTLQSKINSVGCPACRPRYREELVRYLSAVQDRLSPESRKRLATNPIRILDSKNEEDIALTVHAPLMKDHLCDECRIHFDRVQGLLHDHGVAFEVDGRLVRGLDYYTKTAYEIQSGHLGAQNALGGGGRYDSLVESLGGKPTPGVGFAAGMERLLLVMESEGVESAVEPPLDAYVIALGPAASAKAMPYVHALRQEGMACDMDFLNRSLKAQMREANRQRSRYAVILGDQEIADGGCAVKNMQSGAQETVPLTELVAYLRRVLRP